MNNSDAGASMIDPKSAATGPAPAPPGAVHAPAPAASTSVDAGLAPAIARVRQELASSPMPLRDELGCRSRERALDARASHPEREAYAYLQWRRRETEAQLDHAAQALSQHGDTPPEPLAGPWCGRALTIAAGGLTLGCSFIALCPSGPVIAVAICGASIAASLDELGRRATAVTGLEPRAPRLIGVTLAAVTAAAFFGVLARLLARRHGDLATVVATTAFLAVGLTVIAHHLGHARRRYLWARHRSTRSRLERWVAALEQQRDRIHASPELALAQGAGRALRPTSSAPGTNGTSKSITTKDTAP